MIADSAVNTPATKRQRSVTTDEEIKKFFCAMTRAKLVLHANDALTVAASSAELIPEYLPSPIPVLTAQGKLSFQNDALPVMDARQCHEIVRVYKNISHSQSLIFDELRLAHNDAETMASVTEWILEIAKVHNITKQTLYSGIYLFYTYMAHIDTMFGTSAVVEDCGRFSLYKGRQLMQMRNEDKSIIFYPISEVFRAEMGRTKNRLLIAATCLCMAAKMEESHFDTMLKPSQIIIDMQKIGHPIGLHMEFDFITVERDILDQLQWRLFRIETPIPLLEMLFVCYNVSTTAQLQARELLAKCISNRAYALRHPSELAALCVVTALHMKKGLYASAGEIVGISKLINCSVEVLLQHSDDIQMLYCKRSLTAYDVWDV